MKPLSAFSKQLTPQLLGSVGLVGLLAACSTTLNTKKLEDVLKKGLEDQNNTEIASVSCPEKIEIEEGDTFECDVEASDGSKASLTVTQQDDEGNVTWKLNPAPTARNNDQTNSSEGDDTPDDLLPSEDPPSPEPSPTPADVDPNAPLLDSDVVESTIQEQFAQQAGISVRSVACPQNVAIKVGSKFNCTITASDGKTIQAVVNQTNEQGGFTWNATNGLISYDKVEGLIRKGLQEQESLAVTPNCGTPQTRYIIAYAGEKFKCSATDPNGRKIPIDVSVKSDDGQVLVNWRI
ncbi:DUF4333 domain-containing protein [Acaryochloris sp. IP29b_bin.137]|uniref:DUF4333 domain-containing protein n=1 Tax=Acaryochloris sp. IP29b_bin.137 TaxID=2969217 RepID=UPI0026371167|nr:DUF4333 domain-containing protein [Acaryochloris sp. IP29b_bin.137]